MRTFRDLPLEIRIRRDDDGPTKLEGHAAVFNVWTDIGKPGTPWHFRERIAPGAFRDTLGSFDTAALFNHDANQILGRLNAKTLQLEEDDEGLRFEIDLDTESELAMQVARHVERGELWGNSFSFTVEKQTWDEDDEGNIDRTITRIGTLYDVGPVTFPAYEQTDLVAREMRDAGFDREPEVVIPEPQGKQAQAKARAESIDRRLTVTEQKP